MNAFNPQAIHELTTAQTWRWRYATAVTPEERWEVIREIYRHWMPEILARSAQHKRAVVYRNVVDWQFTPIEAMAWDTILSLGMPLYPQLPVDRFFLDFGNPYYQVGLELDGADFHLPWDNQERDRLLVRQGWHIFRIRGAESHVSRYPCDNPEEALAAGTQCDSADAVIAAIDRIYFRDDAQQWKWYRAALLVLESHRLAPFAIGPVPRTPMQEHDHEWQEPESLDDWREDERYPGQDEMDEE